MNYLTKHSINTQLVFNSALGIILAEGGKYRGDYIDVDTYVKLGVSKGWVVSEANKTKLTKEPSVPNIKPADVMLAEWYAAKYEQCMTRGIPFELTLSDIKQLQSRKTCYYTGQKVFLTTDSSRQSNRWTLDRIDNHKGYTRDNVVVCAKWVNQLKNEVLENPSSSFRTDLKTLTKIVGKLNK